MGGGGGLHQCLSVFFVDAFYLVTAWGAGGGGGGRKQPGTRKSSPGAGGGGADANSQELESLLPFR